MRIPLDARILAKSAAAGTVIVTQRPASGRAARLLRQRGATLLELPGRAGRVSMRVALRTLVKRGVSSVLIEGGGVVAAAALREQVVDRLLLFFAPELVGGDGRPMIGPLGVARMSRALKVELIHVNRVGDDVLIEAAVQGAARGRGQATFSRPDRR